VLRDKQFLTVGRLLQSVTAPIRAFLFSSATATVSEAWSSGHVPKKLRRLSSVVAAIGAFILTFVAATVSDGWILQSRGQQEFKTLAAPAAPASASKRKPKRGELLGKLVVPRLKMSVIVLEGSDDGVLKKGPGHIEETAFPGELGNVAISGHRDTHFRPLREVKTGDEIILQTKTTSQSYYVQSWDIIDPTDMQILDPTPGPMLTLVTCYPFEFIGSAPMRYIIRATPRTGPVGAATHAKD